jgi:hypothetical protein
MTEHQSPPHPEDDASAAKGAAEPVPAGRDVLPEAPVRHVGAALELSPDEERHRRYLLGPTAFCA